VFNGCVFVFLSICLHFINFHNHDNRRLLQPISQDELNHDCKIVVVDVTDVHAINTHDHDNKRLLQPIHK
jgi:hypothetical protein